MATNPDATTRKVLVAVDETEVSEHAAVVARRIFGDQAQYVRLHADDDVVDTILQAAHDDDVDVIVLGSRDHGWFARLRNKSTSRHVAARADRPVLLVKQSLEADAGHAATTGAPLVMIGSDGSEAAIHAARAAAALFGPDAGYELVHIAAERPDPNADASGFAGALMSDEEADEIEAQSMVEAEAALADTVREMHGVTVTQTVLVGSASVMLCARAEVIGADLLVLGSTGASNLLHVLLGSVSSSLVTNCGVPLLLIPSVAE